MTDIRPFTRQFYRGNRPLLLLTLVQTLVMTAANLLIAWLLQQILDLIAGVDTGFTLAQLTALAGAGVALAAASYGCAYWSKPRFLARAMAQYRDYAFGQLSRKGMAAFQGEGTSLYASALNNDAGTIRDKYLTNLFLLLDQSVLLAGALVMMLWYSPLLTTVSLGLSLLPVLASLLAGDRVAKAERRVSDANENYMSTLRDSLAGFSVVKSFRAEEQMCRLFGEKVRALARAREGREKAALLVEMLSVVAGVLVQVGVFLVGAGLALNSHGITAGTVLVFVQLLNYVLTPIGTIPICLAERKAARELIQKLADALAENQEAQGSVQKANLIRGISLDEVTFGYEPDQPVLRDLTVQFEAGKSYALVGTSGSGKSTLLHLLMGARRDYAGSIRWDDTQVRDLSDQSLYALVSLVQQNVFLFQASIQDNITLFTPFPQEDIDRAVRQSGLLPLVEQRGMDYPCGENGSNLSGGEKQRVSIARSLLKDCRVLLVDEATAALDPQTARQVSQAILNLDHLTRIVVTHSLEESLLDQYDNILTLKGGQLVEAGTFRELMERKGYFYSLVTLSQ